jgi:fatty-acyl-CoA synthase
LVLSTDAQDWMDTGDLGRLDPAGRLLLCGRTDTMVVSGGENVFPGQLEVCLLEHPQVEEAAVAVAEDAEFGKRLRAFVVLRDGALLDTAELRVWLGERVDRSLRPRTLTVLPQLPRTLLGKIDRATLQMWSEATGDAQAEATAVAATAPADGCAPPEPTLYAKA